MSNENTDTPAAKIKVIALQVGFYDGQRRREGDVFEVDATDEAKWFTPVFKNELQGSAAADRTSPSPAQPEGNEGDGEDTDGEDANEGDDTDEGEDDSDEDVA